MRNKLLIIAIVICSLFIADKVSAANFKYDYNSSEFDILNEHIDIVNNIIKINDDYNTLNKFFVISFFRENNNYYLEVGIANGYSNCMLFAPYYNSNIKYGYFSNINTYTDVTKNLCSYTSVANDEKYKGFTHHYDLNLSNYDNNTLNDFYSNIKKSFENDITSANNLSKQIAINFKFGISSTTDMLKLSSFFVPIFSNSQLKFAQYYSQYNDTMIINDVNYSYLDDIQTYYDYHDLSKPKTPNITINIENTLLDDNNEVLQKKISINWGLKNQSMYKYMFRDSTAENDTWKYFFTDDITDEILVNKNGSYTFQVTDLDGNYVTGTAVTITGIREQLPTLKLSDYTGQGCYYNNQQICAILTLYSENADFSQYTLQYRFSNGEWITHNYDNSAKGQIPIYENTTLTARLIRNIDKKLIDSASYTITKINPNITTEKPTFKFDKTFCTNLDPNNFHELGNGNYKQTLKMTIYGLDMTKYRVFISEGDNHNFTEITQFEYEDRVPLVKYYYFEYYTDTYFVVKITDLDGNYVTGTAYTLHFTCNDVDLKLGDFEDMNDIFTAVKNFFNKFKDIMIKIKEVIEYFYNSLNGEIKAFILTAFILIIVLNLIMRMMK